MSKLWTKAADAYRNAARCEADLDGRPATLLVDAALCMKNVNTSEAMKLMEEAITYQLKDGKHIRQAAKNKETIAGWLEDEKEYALAYPKYLEAADLYATDNSEVFADKFKIKAADLMVLSSDDKLIDALKIYEATALKDLKDSLKKPLAKSKIFKAVLIYLANDDAIGAKKCLDNYNDEDPSFEGSREEKLLRGLGECIDSKSIESFESLLKEYTKVCTLDKLQTKLLHKIKEKIGVMEGESMV